MIVIKFGGTSVQDAAAIRNAAAIVAARRDRRPLVVVSACAGVTSALIGIARKASEGSVEEAAGALQALHARHDGIADSLTVRDRKDVKEVLASDFAQLDQLARSIAVLGDLTPRALDQLSAYGEIWSSMLVAHALRENGIAARWLDARKVLITDSQHTRAAPLFDLTESAAKEMCLPPLGRGEVVVTQGFIGATRNGVTTTIGRGGSDYSAAIFGAALDAEEIQIWTDVDGVLTADPSLVSGARLIRELTFGEAAELAYFGARVLHPSTILPAIRKNIPVRVMNSLHPGGEGTLIANRPAGSASCEVKAIAHKSGITVINIQSTRMLMAHGFLAQVFDIFKNAKKSIDVVVTSEVGISLTIDDREGVDEIVSELSRFADVTVEHGRAVVCVVGEKMRSTRGIAGRVFDTLGREGVNVELISHGGSEINLTFVIGEESVAAAVGALHKQFFPASG